LIESTINFEFELDSSTRCPF